MKAASPLAPFVTISREVIADCRVFKVERVCRTSGLSGKTHDFFHIDASNWVNVIAITPDEHLLFVRQERHGIEGFTLEVPAGMVDANEDPAVAALRELREETGFAGMKAESIGWVHPNPALQDNRCFTYLVRDVVPVGSQQLDEREEIEVVLIPLSKVRELVRNGKITHALAVVALYFHELSQDST